MEEIYLDYQEAWIYINGEKTIYKICSSGQVFNTRTNQYMKGGRDKDGYHIISLTHNKKKYTRKVHRLVALAFIPNPDNLPEVNHKDGKKWHNEVHNLEWVTTAGNVHHAQNMGLRPQTVTEDDVLKICRMLSRGKTPISKISKKTGVDIPMIRRIYRRERWTSLSKMYDFSKFHDDEQKPHGSKNGMSKLSEADAHYICILISRGKKDHEIAKETGISIRAINCIRKGTTWRRISKIYKIV